LRELTGTTLLRLHSLEPFTRLCETLKAGGISLPGRVNQCLGQDPAVLCLAPRQWLLFSESLPGEHLMDRLEPLIDRHRTALLDTSAGLAVFRLAGSAAPWLLSKLGGLDFHSANGAGAHCARTRLQHAAVTIHYHQPAGDSGQSVFDLIVDCSIAAWLGQLLTASIPHAEHLYHHHGART
jgi:heterotetrameric sarcosine oxidase gamma subunit